jgi:CRISPR type I-E-associated protein CasB/Cse2
MIPIEVILAPPSEAPPGAESPARPATPARRPYGSEYALLALRIHSEGYSRGDRAALRRLSTDPRAVPPEVFWRAVGDRIDSDEDERFWRSALLLMARHRHLPGSSLGEQLEGPVDRPLLPNSRLERWLRLDRERAREDARRVLSRLDDGVNWADLGPLLHHWTPAQRRRVAQSFFRARHRRG